MTAVEFPPFQHINWSPDRAELHRFALAMLLGFGILGLMAAWRGHPPWPLWGAGAALAVAALVPGLGRLAYVAVYAASGLIGYVVSRALLTLIFVVLFVPLGVLLRAAGKDPLGLKADVRSGAWLRRDGPPEARDYYRQY